MKGYKRGIIAVEFFAKRAKNGTHLKWIHTTGTVNGKCIAFGTKIKRNKINLEIFLEK